MPVDAKEIECYVVFNQSRCGFDSDGVHDVDCRGLAGNGPIGCSDAGISYRVIHCLAVVLAAFQSQRLADFIEQRIRITALVVKQAELYSSLTSLPFRLTMFL